MNPQIYQGKICPFFSIAFGREVECMKERCAFYDPIACDCRLLREVRK